MTKRVFKKSNLLIFISLLLLTIITGAVLYFVSHPELNANNLSGISVPGNPQKFEEQNKFSVGEYTIIENVYYRTDSWLDADYDFVYVVKYGNNVVNLGMNKTSEGGENGRITVPPKIINDKLVVYTGNTVFIFNPKTKQIYTFDPFQVEEAIAFGYNYKHEINWVYDYRVVDLKIDGKHWTLEYRRNRNSYPDQPEVLYFESNNSGRTFNVRE